VRRLNGLWYWAEYSTFSDDRATGSWYGWCDIIAGGGGTWSSAGDIQDVEASRMLVKLN